MKYEKIKYPDGQISVRVLNPDHSEIRERINSYEDLFFIKSIADASKPYGVPLSLFIPCLFGQRSDRRFNDNHSFDLKIICDFINSCKFNRVEIFDPHSDVALALINNSKKRSSIHQIEQCVDNIADLLEKKDKNACGAENLILVSPDAGAYKKVFEYGGRLALPVVAANKFRDKEGNITLHFLGDVKDKDCLIVDDLCDGGYTFLKLGEALKAQGASKVYLYVSHGYFSKGFEDLRKVIDHVYCTNSVKDLPAEITKDFITQFKVI